MIVEIILYVGLALLIFLLHRFIAKPYLRMLKYKGYSKVFLMKFIPIIGAFKLAQDAYKETGNELYYSNKTFDFWPKARMLVLNVADKCLLLLLDPQLIKEFYQNQDKYEKEKLFIENKIRFFGQGVAFAEGKEWSKKRKIMSNIFHYSFYQKFIPKIQAIIDREILKLKSNQEKKFQAKQFAAIIAGDTIVKTFFGISFEQKIQGKTMSAWLRQVIGDSVTQQRSFRGFFFGAKILNLGICEFDRKMNERIKIFKTITQEAIQRKMSEEKQESGTVLEQIVVKKLYKTEQGYTLEELIAEFGIFFVAGTDTTSHLLAMCFYYLSIYPELQDRLREEVKQSKILDHIEFKGISNLKLLDNFINETFRHYNYMVGIFPRVATQDHQLAEVTIHKGDVILLGWSINNYNPEYFPEPEKFDPDRWSSTKDKQKLLSYVFSPFSMGSRNCLGQHFALLEVKIVLCKMVVNFKHELAVGYKHLLKTNSLYGPVNDLKINLLEL